MQPTHVIKSTLAQLKEAHSKRIERIVCSGGGAKGVVYPGSYKAMEDTGVFKGVQTLSGASAGAITATMMALGMPSSEFRKKLLTTNLKDLMGTTVGTIFGKNAPGIAFITKDGKPLEEFIREGIITTIKEKLLTFENIEKITDKELQQLLDKLKTSSPSVTFGDLAVLNRHFPEHFKSLTMPAVKFPSGKVQIFSSELTPEVEIALACRASASIPVILEPVTIVVDGAAQQFVDGGVYDNLPTDYFDLQADTRTFARNTRPEQTLVFAFGEGLDNKTNQVFQALYGTRWDEVVDNELLADLMRAAIVVAKRVIESGDRLDPTEEAQLLSQSIKFVLDQHVKQNAMTIDESKAIMTAMKKSINSILLKPQDYQAFWDSYQQKGDEESKLALLANIIKEKMKPILYDAGIIEQLKRNTLVRVLGDFIAPYRNTDQKEIGYQKLRAQYALRTVELRVGDIKTTDFDEATKAARVMDTLGYLDTINHITNHELHDPEVFNTGEFYLDIVTNFDAIYKAVLAGAGKELERDKLMQTINTLQNQLRIEGKSEEDIARNVYQLIKDKVEENLDSAQAFALSRAVEYRNGVLTAQELFKETYEEGFKRSGTFAMSNITGERILRTGSLHEALKGKDMFELYRNQSPHNGMTRTDKVFASLENLTSFRGAYETAPQVEQGKGFKSDL